jgi:hypothetical protein
MGCNQGCSTFQNCCSDCIKEDEAAGLRGFQHFGKVTPGTARHELYRAVMSSMLQNIEDGCHESSLTCLLQNALSPHQRVQTLADLAAGLRCKETPLPPDTAAHYAALIAVHAHICTFLEIETDSFNAPGDLEDPSGYYRYDDENRKRPRQFTEEPTRKPSRGVRSSPAGPCAVLGSKSLEEETAEQRSKAMQHLMVKKVGKQHSDSELLVALGAQAAGSVDSPWFGTSPQDIARQNSDAQLR